MSILVNLNRLSIVLPVVTAPLGAYVPAVKAGDWVYVSGQLPLIQGVLSVKGHVGGEVDVKTAQQAARVCFINTLAAVVSIGVDLNTITRVVKITGLVNSAPGFTGQPQVVNGASDLCLELFGDIGRHARVAAGVSELPLGSPVEVETVFYLGHP